MSSSQNPIGVNAVLANANPTRTAISLFSLIGRVAIITGAHRGIGLEAALAYAEAGAVVYCLDLPEQPDQDWLKVQKFVQQLPSLSIGEGSQTAQGKGRLEYAHCDVTNQKAMWDLVEKIADKEGRLDVCFANAGILQGAEVLDYPAEDFKKVRKERCFGEVCMFLILQL